VNDVARWASLQYAYKIYLLLDSIFEIERKALTNKIDTQTPRTIPIRKEKSYKYMNWQETLKDNKVMLHLVRRRNNGFDSGLNEIKNSDKCLFFRENIPIAMTPNEDVRAIVKNLLGENQYKFKSSKVEVFAQHVPTIIQRVTEYFDRLHE
jgi:hypothetical protein